MLYLYLAKNIITMEHFLPLAVASMVISLISIILLDYFGPKSSTPEQESLSSTTSDTYESTEEHQVIPEDTIKEIVLEQESPIRSNNFTQSPNDNPPVIQFYLLNKLMNFQYSNNNM